EAQGPAPPRPRAASEPGRGRPMRPVLVLVLVLVLGRSVVRAEDLRPSELADRLSHARKSAKGALYELDAESDDPVEALRKDAKRLAGAKVQSGSEVLDVDPGLAKELERFDAERSSTARRDQLARLERRLGA